MSRRAAAVTQADIARAIRAARQAGLEVLRLVARPDGVSIETSNQAEVIQPPAAGKRVVVL